MRFLLMLAIVVVGTNVDIFLARSGVAWMGIHVGIVLAISLGLIELLKGKRQTPEPIKSRHFANIILVSMMLFGWSLLSASQSIYGEVSLLTVSRWVLAAVTAIVIVHLSSAANLVSTAQRGISISIFIVSFTVIVDVISPGTFGELTTRAGGLYINPNAAAHSLIMLFLCYLSLAPREDYHANEIMLFCVVSISIFSTLSRSGIVLWTILAVFMFFRHASSRRFSRIFIIFGVASIALGSFYSIFSYSKMSESATTSKRIEQLANLDFYTDLNDSRVSALRYYMSSPVGIFGNGPGLTNLISGHAAGAHNSYVRSYWETGVIGGLLYIIIILLVLSRGLAPLPLAAFIVLAVQSVFSHANLDNRLFYMTIFIVPLALRENGSAIVAPLRSTVNSLEALGRLRRNV